MLEVTDELYESMVNRDTKFDGQYYVGIISTGIVCFPSCRSRLPKRENVRVYTNLSVALHAGFRPCKRCKPDNPHRQSPDEVVVNRVIELLRERFRETVTLNVLADELNMSPYHLQRIFKRFTGISPSKQLLQIRIDQAKQLLLDTQHSIAEVATQVGFRSASHFSVAFQRELGSSPKEYRVLSRVYE